MVTYEEGKKHRHTIVLLKGDSVIATFGNLKKLTEYLSDQDIPSYWTLARKDFPLEFGEYKVFKVKHH